MALHGFFESPGQFTYDDIIYTVGFNSDVMDRVTQGHFQLHEDDVLVSSYPKAGTSWGQAIVSLIYGADDLDATNAVPFNQRVPFLEFHEPNQTALIDKIEAASPPRLIKTHLPAHFLMQQKNVVDKKTRIVYMMRNPKDTLVSYYHFYRMNEFFGCFKGSWNEFFEMFKHNKLGFGYWFDIILEWWAYRDKFNILFVMYEDLQRDPHGEVKRIADFCDKTLPPQVISRIVQLTSFAGMKSSSESNMDNVKGLRHDISSFLRKGKVGDWKNYFCDEQNTYFDELFEQKLAGSGLSFQFEL